MNAETPLIFDIKRGSLDDGPGIRTVVFLKGCPLNCSWCHNPESINPGPEVFYDAARCTGCGNCGKLCPSGALRRVGKRYAIRELTELLLEDGAYYRVSGGGVTFSGGEPALYMEYVGAVAQSLFEHGIPTALETCGYFDMADFGRYILPYLTILLYDVKLIGRPEHIRHTGRDNRVILDNLRALASKITVIPRTPLIPGVTDTDENLSGIAGFLRECGLEQAHILLPFNGAGERKRGLLRHP
ncbi:MAG: radical SAM protein [Oscillospiraceae bacterium]|nr:radical SAM protein [Oscillospiraceae bacterium]